MTAALPAYAGNQQLELTTQATSDQQETQADLTIDLAGQTGVRLRFAHRRIEGSSSNGSGIYLSDDGGNFVFVLSLGTLDSGQQYEFYSLDLDKLAVDNGLVFNVHFVIRFLWKGWAFDDVRVVPTNFSLLESFPSDNPTGLGNFGASPVSVADLDGDGVRDLAVGHPGYSLKRGRIEFFSGQSGAYLWSWSKGLFGERLGESLVNLGDFDGDGFDELLIGAPGNDQAGSNAGAVYVYSTKTGTLLKEFFGASAGDLFGAVVGSIGDLNGDGLGELVIGSPLWDINTLDEDRTGRVGVYSSSTGALLLQVIGTGSAEDFGRALAGIGDVDGDSVPGLAVGMPRGL